MVVLNVLETFSANQALEQSTHNSIQEFDHDREATISWSDQVELVAERTGIDPSDIEIRKLKGLALGNVIEQYSNVPYASDAMFAYSQIAQQADEAMVQYLIKAKVLLERIHHNSKLSDISGAGLDDLSFV